MTNQGRINVYIEKCKYITSYRNRFLNVKFNKGTGKFDMSDDFLEDTIYEKNTQPKQVRDARI